MDQLPKIPNWELEKELAHGSFGTLYLAKGLQGKVAAAKIQRSQISSQSELFQFRQESIINASLSHPNILKCFEMGEVNHRGYLVMEYFESQTLTSKIEQGTFSEEKLIEVAKQILQAVSSIHAHGYIHRDLKPDNILLNEHDALKVIDFGLATQTLTKKTENSQAVGTFLYCSPEQAGVTQQPVDFRTDLYSIGCILFQCATGQVPFFSSDLGTLLRMLATEPVPDLHKLKPDLSQGICILIQKLLSKDVDDRYSNAESVLYDFNRLGEINSLLKSNSPVTLGFHGDQPIQPLALPLIGRDSELRSLKDAWNAVLGGQGKTMILEAPAGMGKSRLLDEFSRQLYGKNALILTGSFQRESVSFAGLCEAIDSYLNQVRRLDAQFQSQIFSRWRKAADNSAPILGAMSAGLKTLFHSGSDNIEGTEKNILYEVLSHFLIQLSKEYSSVVLILENFQWIDTQTQEVLTRIQRDYAKEKVLILGSGLTDDADQWKSRLKDRSETFSLTSLSEAACNDLIRTYLGGRELQQELVHFLQNASQGNPLTLSEYLKTMLQRGLIQVSAGMWKGELKTLQGLSMSTNVEDLLIRRLSTLSAQAREALQVAAVLGYHFDLNYLRPLMGREIGGDISQAVYSKVIEVENQSKYRFLHLCILDHLIEELGTDKRQELHQKAAEYLDQLPKEEKTSEGIVYSLADHFSKGLPHKNPTRTYECQYQAGMLAFLTGKNLEAKVYLLEAEQIALKNGLSVDKAGLFLQISHNYSKILDEYDKGLGYLEKALEHSRDPLQRAKIYNNMGPYVVRQQGHHQYLHCTELAFKELGIKNPTARLQIIATTLFRGFMAWSLYSTRWHFGSKGSETEETAHHLRVWMHMGGGAASDYTGNTLLAFFHAISAVYYAHFVGLSTPLIGAYTVLQTVASVVGLGQLCLKFRMTQIELIKEYFERLSSKRAGPKISDTDALVTFLLCSYRFPSKSGLSYEETVTQTRILVSHSSHLISLGAYNILKEFFWTSFLRGYHLDTKWMLEFLETRSLDKKGVSEFLRWKAAILAVEGEIAEAFRNLPNEMPTEVTADSFATIFCALSLFLETEEWEKADRWIHLFLSKVGKNTSLSVGCTVLMSFYIYAEQSEKNPSKRQNAREFGKKFLERSNVRVLEFFYPHSRVIDAILKVLDGKFQKAVEIFDDAERGSILHDNPLARYFSCLYRARAFLKWSASNLEKSEVKVRYKEAATVNAQKAVDIAIRQKWVLKVRKVLTEFNLKQASSSSNGHSLDSLTYQDTFQSKRLSVTSSTALHTRSVSTETVKLKKYLDALLSLNQVSAQVASAEAYVNSALDQSLKILNAERALLFLGEVNSSSQPQFVRTLKNEEVASGIKFSRSQLRKVIETRRAKVYTGDENDNTSTSSSIMVNNLKSLMIAPILKDEQCLGAIYLDSSLARGIFSEDDLDILLAIASHIAINFEAARTKALEQEKKELEKDLEVKRKIQAAYEALEKATRNIRTIFSTINQGIFTLDADLKIQDEYSSYLETLLGEKALAGKSIVELLGKDTSINADQLSQIWNACSFSIGETELNFEMNSSNLPREFSRTLSENRIQYFEMDWAPLVGSDELIQGLMVTLRDVSLLKDLKQQAEKSHAELRIIHQLLAISPNTTQAYFENSEKLLIANDMLLSSLKEIQSDQQAFLFRNLHTLKGNSRSFEFDRISNCVHEAEEVLKSRDIEKLKSGHAQIRAELSYYQQVFREKLSRSGGDSSLGFDVKNLDAIVETAQRLAASDSTDVREFQRLIQKLLGLKKVPLQTLVATAGESAKSIAYELGKSPPSVVYQGEPVFIDPEKSHVLMSVLNHLVRNSIDHGFDADSAEPKIVVEGKREGQKLSFKYSDNGKGLNLRKIREKGMEKNLIEKEATPEAVADLIFLSGFSSRDQVTQISGRGVGMDAVREMLKDLGGGTSIRLLTPESVSGFSKFEIDFYFSE